MSKQGITWSNSSNGFIRIEYSMQLPFMWPGQTKAGPTLTSVIAPPQNHLAEIIPEDMVVIKNHHYLPSFTTVKYAFSDKNTQIHYRKDLSQASIDSIRQFDQLSPSEQMEKYKLGQSPKV